MKNAAEAESEDFGESQFRSYVEPVDEDTFDEYNTFKSVMEGETSK